MRGWGSYLVVQKQTGAIGTLVAKKYFFSFGGSLLSIIVRGGSQNDRWVSWNSVHKAVKLC